MLYCSTTVLVCDQVGTTPHCASLMSLESAILIHSKWPHIFYLISRRSPSKIVVKGKKQNKYVPVTLFQARECLFTWFISCL